MIDLPCFNGDSHSRTESTAIISTGLNVHWKYSQNHPTGISVVVDQIKEDYQLHKDIGDDLYIKRKPRLNKLNQLPKTYGSVHGTFAHQYKSGQNKL